VRADTPSSLAAVIGLSNKDVILLRFLRSLRCLRCVGWKPRLTALSRATDDRRQTIAATSHSQLLAISDVETAPAAGNSIVLITKRCSHLPIICRFVVQSGGLNTPAHIPRMIA